MASEANELAVAVKKPQLKKWQRILFILLFIAINVAVIAATAINEFGDSANAAELAEVKISWWLLIPATLCFAVMILLEFWKYAIMLREMTRPGVFTRREIWKLSVQTVMLGRYYDRITPASVGGQPFQIYNLTKTGKVPHGAAAAIPIFSMISGQAMFIIIAVPCFLIGSFIINKPALMSLAWVGLAFYAFWPALVTGAAFFPKPTTRFIKFFAKMLAKLHIVKDREKALSSIESEVTEYTKSVRRIAKQPRVLGSVLVMSLFSNMFMSFIPYFVLKAFGGDMDFMQCFLLTVAVESAVYFVPTPGNSGAAEGTFYMVFSSLSTGYVFWAMLAWRFFSYYIYIIGGPLVYLEKHLAKRRHNDY